MYVDDLSHHPDIESIELADFLFNSPQQGNTPAKEQSIFITAYKADVSSDRTVYTHIQMLF